MDQLGRRSSWRLLTVVLAALGVLACGEQGRGGSTLARIAARPTARSVRPELDLRINEVVSNNEGVWLDEQGEADDYFQVFNPTASPIDLSDYSLADEQGTYALPRCR